MKRPPSLPLNEFYNVGFATDEFYNVGFAIYAWMMVYIKCLHMIALGNGTTMNNRTRHIEIRHDHSHWRNSKVASLEVQVARTAENPTVPSSKFQVPSSKFQVPVPNFKF